MQAFLRAWVSAVGLFCIGLGTVAADDTATVATYQPGAEIAVEFSSLTMTQAPFRNFDAR